jgi:predicted Ser/Thr protein kinase
LTPLEIRCNGTLYRVVEIIDTGLTSVVYKTTDGAIIKRYNADVPITKLEREVYWLDRLRETGLVPELLAVDRSSPALLMSDSGEPITTVNAPNDWERQLVSLMKLLKDNKCLHNDLSEHEILVRDGKLRVTDFGSAIESKNDGIFAVEDFCERTRYYLDDYVVNYIRFRLFGPSPGSEPHCFVLWKAGEHVNIQNEISNKFDILRAVIYTPHLFSGGERNRNAILDKFYCGRPCPHGDKGRAPFILYFVLDREPRYETRANPFRGTLDTVNVNVFDLKMKLRCGRTGFLHGSDSIQECFDNLEALTIRPEGLPKSYWLCWRPTFASVPEFFEHLNGVAGLDYLVLRNFDGLVRDQADQSSDIDILVNDFYLFKRASGAIGYKHKSVKRRGPALEYGGYKVAGYVAIGGHEISADIRFVGDGYYCEQWERDMLARRVRLGGMFVPDTENLFYSLLYHALVHKRRVSNQYRQVLGEMASSVGLDGKLAEFDHRLWALLDGFMRDKGYEYVRPRELSICLSTEAKRRMGIGTADDLRAAENFLKKRRPLEAIDLLLGILSDEPDNGAGRRLLLTAERQSRGPGAIRQFVKSMALTRVGRMLPVAIKHPIKRLMLLTE